MIIDGQKWKFYPQKVFDFPKKANFDARLKEHNFDKIFYRCSSWKTSFPLINGGVAGGCSQIGGRPKFETPCKG